LDFVSIGGAELEKCSIIEK